MKTGTVTILKILFFIIPLSLFFVGSCMDKPQFTPSHSQAQPTNSTVWEQLRDKLIEILETNYCGDNQIKDAVIKACQAKDPLAMLNFCKDIHIIHRPLMIQCIIGSLIEWNILTADAVLIRMVYQNNLVGIEWAIARGANVNLIHGGRPIIIVAAAAPDSTHAAKMVEKLIKMDASVHEKMLLDPIVQKRPKLKQLISAKLQKNKSTENHNSVHTNAPIAEQQETLEINVPDAPYAHNQELPAIPVNREIDISESNQSSTMLISDSNQPEFAAANSQIEQITIDFINAAGRGDRATMEALRATGAINGTDQNGLTALHWAINNRRAEVAQFLIDAGANINAVDIQGRSPLHHVVISNNTSMLRMLLSTIGVDLEVKAENGETPLMSALTNYSRGATMRTIACTLLGFGAEASHDHLKEIFPARDLIYAAAAGDNDLLRSLLNHKPDVSIVQHALMYAFGQQNEGGFSLLLQYLEDKNIVPIKQIRELGTLLSVRRPIYERMNRILRKRKLENDQSATADAHRAVVNNNVNTPVGTDVSISSTLETLLRDRYAISTLTPKTLRKARSNHQKKIMRTGTSQSSNFTSSTGNSTQSNEQINNSTDFDNSTETSAIGAPTENVPVRFMDSIIEILNRVYGESPFTVDLKAALAHGNKKEILEALLKSNDHPMRSLSPFYTLSRLLLVHHVFTPDELLVGMLNYQSSRAKLEFMIQLGANPNLINDVEPLSTFTAQPKNNLNAHGMGSAPDASSQNVRLHNQFMHHSSTITTLPSALQSVPRSSDDHMNSAYLQRNKTTTTSDQLAVEDEETINGEEVFSLDDEATDEDNNGEDPSATNNNSLTQRLKDSYRDLALDTSYPQYVNSQLLYTINRDVPMMYRQGQREDKHKDKTSENETDRDTLNNPIDENSIAPVIAFGEASAFSHPLFSAVVTGDTEQVRSILRTKILDINMRDGSGRTPLHLAAMSGHAEIVEMLLHQGAINTYDNSGMLPPYYALLYGHTHILMRLNRLQTSNKIQVGFLAQFFS